MYNAFWSHSPSTPLSNPGQIYLHSPMPFSAPFSLLFNNLQGPICVAHIHTGIRPLNGTWMAYSDIYLKRTDVPLSGQQLPDAPQLLMGAGRTLPRLCWNLLSLVLYRLYAGKHRCCGFMSTVALSCPEETSLWTLPRREFPLKHPRKRHHPEPSP